MVATQIQTVQISCINKPDRYSGHEAITHVGGNGWKWTRQQAIQAIEAKTHQLYTSVGGRTAWIGVRTSANGTKFLQTHADDQWNNNLLALAECP